MPTYRIEIPFYTRGTEIHIVQADSEDEALQIAEARDSDEVFDDPDYYELAMEGVEITKVSTDTEDLADAASAEETTEDLRERYEQASGNFIESGDAIVDGAGHYVAQYSDGMAREYLGVSEEE